jgi:signal transduction histidine kinase
MSFIRPPAHPLHATHGLRRLRNSLAAMREYLRRASPDIPVATAVADAVAQERDRIARRLHDELTQELVLIRWKLGELRAPRSSGSQVLAELDALVARAARTSRSLTFDLAACRTAAPDVPSLEGLAAEFAARADVQVSVEAAYALADLPEPTRQVAARVVRELCMNAQKHACAQHVRITSQLDRGLLSVAVHDDGSGLQAPAPQVWRTRRDGGFGLASAQAQLRALGGDLSLSSRPGAGTCARLVVPLACKSGRTGRTQ